MKVAFYAPLKPPDHPTPSGDRAMARGLSRALRMAGYRVEVASRFRSYEGTGCARRQQMLRRRGEALATRLLRRYERGCPDSRPGLWFTYHVYHKSPDWIGPPVAAALGIPYVIAEASNAPRQHGGAWAEGHAAAAAAIRQAAALICLNPVDVPGLLALDAGAPVHSLAPFIDVERIQRLARHVCPGRGNAAQPPRLVTVAMMREGDKLASYRVLAQALSRLLHLPWRLQIVGDGSARARVQEAFAGFPASRVQFLGALAPAALPKVVLGAHLHVWPAVNEAWGMVFLEAAALGVASVAGDGGGVPQVVAHERSGILTRAGDPASFAAGVERALCEPGLARALGNTARERAERLHGLATAARGLGAVLGALT